MNKITYRGFKIFFEFLEISEPKSDSKKEFLELFRNVLEFGNLG